MTSETPIVQFIDVCKSFDGNLILENLNLSINKGDLIAIIGPSGLRSLLGLAAGAANFLMSDCTLLLPSGW